jgi:hypothetical protein
VMSPLPTPPICPLRIMFITSYPCSVRPAVSKEKKPIPGLTSRLIPIPLLCGRIKEKMRKHKWKGMKILHGASNHPSGLASVGG